MRNGWRVAGLGAALTAVAMTTACGSSTETDAAASSASSASAAASAAATAAPGTYGAPVDPSLPNPTDVASDTPVPAPTAGAADPTDPAGAAAEVVITYSGWTDAPAGVEVGAYLAGVAESGGTCTLTLTSGAGSATAAVPGEPDAASTSCPNLTVPGTALSSGTWSAVVSYESPSTSGTSAPVEVVVP